MAQLPLRVLRRLALALEIAGSVLWKRHNFDLHMQFVGGEPPRDHKPGILLVCCDVSYYERFARALIATAMRNSPRQHLHLHVYEPTDTWKAEAQALTEEYSRVTASWEDSTRNPFRDKGKDYIYFAAARFAVACRVVEQSNSAVLVVDADGVVVRGLDEPFASFQDYDIGLILRRTSKPWKKVAAGAVLIQPTQSGAAFIRRLADVIHTVLLRRPDFHVDQMAIHYVYMLYRLTSRRLKVMSLTTRFADWDFHPDSYIWSAKGERKLGFADLVQRVADPATTERPGGIARESNRRA